MTLTIDLSPETEARLGRRAASAGKPLRDVVIELVDEAVSGDEPRRRRVAGTGANLLANVDVDALLATPIEDVFAEYM